MNLNHFKEAMTFVQKWEGGYVSHPSDPGGETNFGISKRAYPDKDIKNLTLMDAAAIYYNDYWVKAGCSDIPYPGNIAVFDTAVNCGVSRAIAWYRKAPAIRDFLQAREDHYIRLARDPGYRVFFRGWMKRLQDLRKLVEIGLEKVRS